MSSTTPSRPVRLALSFAPDGGAWPKHPVVLAGQEMRIYLRAWDVDGTELTGDEVGGVVFTLRRPEGVQVTVEPEDGQEIGALSFGVSCDTAGLWRAEAVSATPAGAAAEITWRVQARGIPAVAAGILGFAIVTSGLLPLAADGGALLTAGESIIGA